MASQQLQKNPVGQIKLYVSDESVKKRFEEMLGKRSGAFLNSIINVVRNSRALQNCAPESVMSAATVAATLNLPIDPALGYAAIVPYGNSAVFQIMYKGVTQLCIRSGQYATIHCSEIYADELKSHNPITGVVKFKDPDTFKMRYAEKKEGNVVGHYAYLKLVSGFEKSDYMTRNECMAHARKYSKAYQRDLKTKKKDCPWSTDPIPMCNKTVLLRLLKKYGVMSIEMQDAVIQDNSFEAAEETAAKKIESEQGSVSVDAEFENKPETTKPKTKKELAAEKKKAKADAKGKAPDTKYLCYCKACGINFDKPKTSGTGANQKSICPECLSANIVANEGEKEKPEFLND